MTVTHRRIVRLALVAAVMLAAACGGTSTEDRAGGDGGDALTTTVAPAVTRPTTDRLPASGDAPLLELLASPFRATVIRQLH